MTTRTSGGGPYFGAVQRHGEPDERIARHDREAPRSVGGQDGRKASLKQQTTLLLSKA
jgi:hypothetical protein